jgi:hypothetical protein
MLIDMRCLGQHDGDVRLCESAEGSQHPAKMMATKEAWEVGNRRKKATKKRHRCPLNR